MPIPVMLEVFNNLFMSIARADGRVAANTAYSVNIKERLDFSCACSHMTALWWPMRRICRCISARWTARSKRSSADNKGKVAPGDVYAINAPTMAAHICRHHRLHAGVRRQEEDHPVLVASRGHHADVGGISPGSMSPNATTIEQGRRLYGQLQAGGSAAASREGTDDWRFC